MVFPLLAAAPAAAGAAGGAAAATGAWVGGANALLGMGQSFLGYQAKKQQYALDTAFQDANSNFAQWQAGFNARLNDANKQYQYWQETVNYNQEMAFANNQRNVETLKAIRQAEVVRDTRVAAGASYLQDSEAIAQQYAEGEMAAAVAQKQYQWRALQARSSVRAMGQQGRSVDRLINDYSRQEGDYMALEAVNEGIRSRQYSRAQAGRLAQYMSQWNSQTFYEEQQIFDPIAPFPPLPTMITPPPPSRRGAPPSAGAMLLGMAGAALGGVETGINTTYKLNQLRTPRSSSGPGTNRATV